MRSLIIFRLVFVVFLISINTLAQEIELWPTKILVNVGPDLFPVDLDEKLAGFTKRRDALGDMTVKVQLDYEKKSVSLQIPDRKIAYRGKFTVLWKEYSNEMKISCIASVASWDINNWSQDNALERLKAEIEWRAMNNFTLLVDEVDRRVYVTPEASKLVEKFGGILNADAFKLPSSKYTQEFKNSKGAIIFDAEDSKLYMRLIDEKGHDNTFQIKKNGEVKPIK